MTTRQSESELSNTGVVFRRDDYAGLWVRVLVDAIDLSVAGLATLLMFFPLLLLSPDDERLPVQMFFLLAFVVWLLYFVCLKYFSRTLGYRLCRVRLVNLQGQPPTLWEVLTRSAFAVTFFAYWLVVDFVWLGGDPSRQMLRDKVAHTYVVRRDAEPSATGPIVY